MPAGDRTGPMGMGSMTGRRAGFCTGNNAPGYANNFAPGPGFGRRGGGRGRRNMYWATGMTGWQRGYNNPYWNEPYAAPAPEVNEGQNLEALKNQAKYFEGALNEINERIKKLEDNNE